ncbi:hypothetical protein SAMN04487989_101966 [Bizionia echini]|uniref:Uncharacterized protein n=1 Tax=Bizionia echini TaxID=649333 RepID=A0A1I4ZNS8_9FLAO|nr:hypothetical protein SAMN04487989_101966 [Bizionia echini]
MLIIDKLFTFSYSQITELKKMKKNILGAIVIFFVAFASLLAISELTNTSDDNIDSTQFYAED